MDADETTRSSRRGRLESIIDPLSSRTHFGEWQVDLPLDDTQPTISGGANQREAADDDGVRAASDVVARNVLRVMSVGSVNTARLKPRLARDVSSEAASSGGQRDASAVRERNRRRPSPCNDPRPSDATARRRMQLLASRAKSASVADVSIGGCLADIAGESSGSVNRLLDDITLLRDRLNTKTAHLSAILNTTSDSGGVSSTKEAVGDKDAASSATLGRDYVSCNDDDEEDEQLAVAIAESYKTAHLEVNAVEKDDASSMPSHTRVCCDRKGSPGTTESATPAASVTSSTLKKRQGLYCGEVMPRTESRCQVRRLQGTLSNSSLSSSSDLRIADGRNTFKSPHQRKQDSAGVRGSSTILEQQRQKQHRRRHEQGQGALQSMTTSEQYEPHLCLSPQSKLERVVCCQRHGGSLPYFWRIHRTVDDTLISLTNAAAVERAYCDPQVETFTATVGQVS
jgi:hypothetical protein